MGRVSLRRLAVVLTLALCLAAAAAGCTGSGRPRAATRSAGSPTSGPPAAQGWDPASDIPAAPLVPLEVPVPETRDLTPVHIKFYYGDLDRVDRQRDSDHALAVLSAFDLIITGEPGQLKPAQRGVLDRLLTAGRQVYGYTHLARTLYPISEDGLRAVIDRMATAGMAGVFFDTAGYDYDVPRAFFNRLVSYAHDHGLKVMANAWWPEDILAGTPRPGLNPTGEPSALGPGDWVLLESFYYRSDNQYAGVPEGGVASAVRKYDQTVTLAAAKGVRVAGLAYHPLGQTFTSPPDRERAYLLTLLMGLQGFAYGRSDDNDTVPWTTLPSVAPAPGALGPLRQVGTDPARWERRIGDQILWFEATDQPVRRRAGIYPVRSDGLQEAFLGRAALIAADLAPGPRP